MNRISLKNDRESFIAQCRVSRETLDRLDRYALLLEKWQRKINLVSATTLPELWTRHFRDSAQLSQFTPASAARAIDLGSGAGFPGLILSIFGIAEMHLVESDARKAAFLREVVRELSLNAEVHNKRIEDMPVQEFPLITARGLAALPELLPLLHRFWGKQSIALLLKGQRLTLELTEASKIWNLQHETLPSQTDKTGAILKLTGIEKKANG